VDGQGFGRRINPAGEAYILRRFADGAGNRTIASELNVMPPQIKKPPP
jgi:hypothetical protein